MKVVIFATHQWPVPTPVNTGHRVYLDLAIALQSLGHDVTMVAPDGTAFDRVLPMRCSTGQAEPTATHCEVTALHDHKAAFESADVIHDWSCEKHAAEWYPKKSVSTVMSGNFSSPRHGRNVVVWSEEMRGRALRGASDYEGTEFSQWHSVSRPLRDVRVCYGGVDTDFWTPGYTCPKCPGGIRVELRQHGRPELYCSSCGMRWNGMYPQATARPKESFFLWLGRWHPARGYSLAIELAKRTGIELVMSGERPEDALNDHQRQCALEAIDLAKNLPNVRFDWLPKEGHREAVREMYRRARAYLFTPLFHEPFGLSQVEAMACGTPVIATEFGSTNEVVGGIDGAVCKDMNRLAIACEIELEDEPGRLAETVRRYAVSRFDRSVMARRYVELYTEALAGGWG